LHADFQFRPGELRFLSTGEDIQLQAERGSAAGK